MDVTLKDAAGTGYGVQVTQENRLLVQSLAIPLQMHEALVHGQAYQVQGSASPNNDTRACMHIENTATNRDLIVTYIRCQFYDYAGGTALPSGNTYFSVGHGQTRSSGGTTATPVNTNAGSANSAEVNAWDQNPTLTGTFSSMDTHHIKEEAELLVYRKEGSIVIPPRKSFTVKITTDHTSGAAYCRVSFMMVEKGEL